MSDQSQKNLLLACLPEVEQQRLPPHLELVLMKLGDVVYESGLVLEYAFFPINCIVSLLRVMSKDDSSETVMIGNDGIVGIFLFMGVEATAERAVVQSGGNAFRLRGTVLKREFKRSKALQHLLLRYTQSLMTQMDLASACNNHHSVSQQLIRWFLLRLDRLPTRKLMMTQGLIANMLGVRRDGVSDAAGTLQAEGLISYDHRTMTVLDWSRVEKVACECYFVFKKEFYRVLQDATAS